MAAKKTNAYEEALTAAERKALKSRVRSGLIEAVASVLEDEIHEEAHRIVLRELKSAEKDAEFMAEIRKIIREGMEHKVSAFAKEFEITSERW